MCSTPTPTGEAIRASNHTLLALTALSFGDERHDVADLVLVGLLTGEWQQLEARVARGLDLEARQAEQVDTAKLERALVAFRYDRRLIAAAELREWLSDRSLRLADLEGVLRRGLLREQSDGIVCSAVAASRVAMVIAAEAICGGTVARCAEELRAWHAGCDVVAEMQLAGSPQWSATTDPAAVESLVVAGLADVASGLPALESAELRRRADRLVALRAGYERFQIVAVSERAVDARLAEHRLDWTVVTGSELSFTLEGAARETRLRVVHDGGTLAQVGEMLGLEPAWRELELGRTPNGLGAELLAARAGDLVGPWYEGERWRVFELCGRFEPDRAADGRARARQELLGELVERAAAGKAGVLAAL